MPRPQRKSIEPSLYLYFLQFMASKSGFALLAAATLTPYMIIITYSNIIQHTATIAKPIATFTFLLSAYEIMVCSVMYKKSLAETTMMSFIIAGLLSLQLLEGLLAPAYRANQFFNERTTEGENDLKRRIQLS
jgi:hypothetical protein